MAKSPLLGDLNDHTAHADNLLSDLFDILTDMAADLHLRLHKFRFEVELIFQLCIDLHQL